MQIITIILPAVWRLTRRLPLKSSRYPWNLHKISLQSVCNCVSNVVYRQRDTQNETIDFRAFWLRMFWLWDVLTLGRFDFGTFWLWDVLTWDVLTLGHFDLGRFDFGTFWPVCSQKMFAMSSLIKYTENVLGTFWLTKIWRFGKSLGYTNNIHKHTHLIY